jgi:tetratricopeptide (TPR) repeat protein
LALGDIARIRRDQGQADEALQMHQERLRIFEELGDKRHRAVVLGAIARIRRARGQPDEALQMHQERLQVLEELGDLEGKANSLWDIAQIEMKRQDYPGAAQHLSESYAILVRIGRLDGICAVGKVLGRLLCAAGQKEEGLAILERCRAGYQQLHQTERAQSVGAIIEQIQDQPK